MKLRILSSIVVVACVAVSGLVPSFIYNGLHVYEFVRPMMIDYTPSIRANGVLEMSSYREVYLETPVIPEEIYVAPGDFVVSGELLATINQEKTIETVKTTQIPIGSENSGSGIDSELLAIANLFGIDASAVTSIVGDYELTTKDVEIIEPINPVAEIYSPITGVVTELNLSVDNIAGVGKPAVTIGDRQSYIAKVSVKEADLPYVVVGQSARISGVGLGGKNYRAYVKQISPVAKKQISGTSSETVIDVELKIISPDDNLMPGLTTKSEIYIGTKREVMIIPYEAVHQDDKNYEYVYVYTTDGITKKFITTGSELFEGIEVTKGIDVKDVVIVTSDELKEKTQAVLREAGNSD